MNTQAEIIEKLMQKTESKSESELAKKMDLSRAAINKYKLGRRHFDNYTIFKISKILNIDVVKLIATAEESKEKEERKKKFWQSILVN